jgi:hypothetical protein
VAGDVPQVDGMAPWEPVETGVEVEQHRADPGQVGRGCEAFDRQESVAVKLLDLLDRQRHAAGRRHGADAGRR